MDITRLSDAGLLSLYDAITTALEFDDAQPAGVAKKYGVRTHADWREWGNTLAAEIQRRALHFRAIPW